MTLFSALEDLGELLATKLTAKGVTASANDGLTTLAGKIDDIETGGGGGSDILTIDDSKAYKWGFTPNHLITAVNIPSGTTQLAHNAFRECTNLPSITIPNTVTVIGDYVFFNCKSLTSISIPNGVTSIGSSAFQQCINLNSITLPNTITSIGSSAFRNCTSLTSITLPSGITSISSSLFSESGIATITIPNSVTTIGNTAFGYCASLTSIDIPSNVTSISNYAFQSCSNLTSITFERTTPPTIGANAFQNVTATVTVPAGTLSAYQTALSGKGGTLTIVEASE